MFNHLGHCVTDLARARRFYEEVLGFRFRNDLPAVPDAATSRLLRIEPPVGLAAVYLERDGFVLELLHFERPGNPPPRERAFNEPGLTHLSFTVDSLEDACAAVTAHGGDVLADTNLGVAVMVRDPDGQLIELLAAPPAG